MTQISTHLVKSIWGISNMEFVAGDAIGFSGENVAIINIYGPQGSNQKEKLWRELSSIINSKEAICVLLRDFNVVRTCEERLGSIFVERDARAFNEFISNGGFHDFVMGGRRFTRFNREDHCPIMLSVDAIDFGPKSFKLFDHWMMNDEFSNVVESSWSTEVNGGSSDRILKNKVKNLKEDIKNRCRAQSIERDRIKNDIQSRLLEWDAKAESGLLSSHDCLKREEDLMDMYRLEQKKRDSLKQKSRVKWSVEGDENTKFFHALVNKNRHMKNLNGLNLNGVWFEDLNSMFMAALDHFSSCFHEERPIWLKFRSDNFRRLDREDVIMLESALTIEEVKAAVWDCSSSKSPGPDGLNFKFIKRYCNVIKFKFFNFIKYFEAHGRLARGCNASFIVLVSKNLDPIDLSDYRPVSLTGCMYKVLSKLLASRLSRVISNLISPNQTAFLAGRQMLDGSLIANEIVNFAKKAGMNLLLFKVDFEKAFDSVNWDFLLDVMAQMNFGYKWCQWIRSCLSSASVSVLINGSPSKEFKMERGLRQGDPLSYFLFLIVAEALQVMFIEACNKGIFRGLYIANEGVNISLLQYADDTLFFGEWLFGIRISLEDVVNVARAISCSHDSLPFTYLGLPIGKNLRKVEAWSEVIDRAPKSVFSRHETITKRFFWGFKENEQKMIWVRWLKVLSDKKNGGLGVGSLKAKKHGDSWQMEVAFSKR
uniref:Reverse transcriptase domain-containing protein n=1 Tax=Tanacetum cinerariifolium TaxID=118510 RepID=A0A699J2T1_TANCI|nr:hypothetical protein [Tanacetum cinerariifolium]